MVNENPQVAINIKQISKCLAYFILGFIDSTEMDIAQSIRYVAKTFNHKSLADALPIGFAFSQKFQSQNRSTRRLDHIQQNKTELQHWFHVMWLDHWLC